MTYIRHDINNNPVSPQPGVSTVSNLGGVSGWSTVTYENYNSDYIAYTYNSPAGIGTRTPGTYQARNIDNSTRTPAVNVRHDETNLPTPILDLRFALNKSLTDHISGNNLITFSRSSTSTYVGADGLIKTAGINEARFDHDFSTGESLGLLIEESRTNLIPQSQQYTSTYWSDLTFLPNGWTTTAGPAPDGSNTVTTWNSGMQIYVTNISYSVGPQHTASVFVKDMTGGGGSVRLGPDRTNRYVGGDPRVTFKPSTQSFTTVGSGVQGYGYHEYPNGWYRVWLKYRLSLSDDIFNIAPLGAYNIGIWGAQIEEGSFPTSHIPTSGSTVTRAADVAEITGTNFTSFYNQSEGTVFVEASNYPHPVTGKALVPFAYSDNSFNNRVTLSSSTGNNQFNFDVTGSGSAQRGILGNFVSTGLKAAGGYKVTGSAGSLAGATAVTSSTTNIPSSINRLDIGNAHNGQQPLNGHIKRLAYMPHRLPDTILQSMTS